MVTGRRRRHKSVKKRVVVAPPTKSPYKAANFQCSAFIVSWKISHFSLKSGMMCLVASESYGECTNKLSNIMRDGRRSIKSTTCHACIELMWSNLRKHFLSARSTFKVDVLSSSIRIRLKVDETMRVETTIDQANLSRASSCHAPLRRWQVSNNRRKSAKVSLHAQQNRHNTRVCLPTQSSIT